MQVVQARVESVHESSRASAFVLADAERCSTRTTRGITATRAVVGSESGGWSVDASARRSRCHKRRPRFAGEDDEPLQSLFDDTEDEAPPRKRSPPRAYDTPAPDVLEHVTAGAETVHVKDPFS